MNPNLKKIRDSVVEHTLKLDDDRLALLLLIQLSRHQNLFIHEPSDWKIAQQIGLQRSKTSR